MPPTNQQQTTAGDALARALCAQLAGREGNIAALPASGDVFVGRVVTPEK